MPNSPAREEDSRKASRYHCRNRRKRLSRKYITTYKSSRKKPEYRPSLPQKDSYRYSEVRVESRAMTINVSRPRSLTGNTAFQLDGFMREKNFFIPAPPYSMRSINSHARPASRQTAAKTTTISQKNLYLARRMLL